MLLKVTRRVCLLAAVLFIDFCALPEPSRREIEKDWTVMVYMVADNSLDAFSVNDINEMERGINKHNSDVIVYLDRVVGANPEIPVVLEISNDKSDDVVSPIIKRYDELDSCDWHNLRDFIDFAKAAYPSRHYGLVFWSHGTGWLPVGFGVKSIGQDVSAGGSEMEITNLVKALDGEGLDFLAFDACLMGDAEVAYTLHRVVPLILFSQTEILSEGFPYDGILPLFHGDDTQGILKEMARTYFDFYQNQSMAYFRSASISVIKSSGMKNLASSLSDFFKTATNAIHTKPLFGVTNFQKITLLATYSNLKFDLLDFIHESVAISSNDVALRKAYSNVLGQWTNTVFYHTNTAFFEDTLPLELNGLNIYLPVETNATLTKAYKKLSWYQDAGMDALF